MVKTVRCYLGKHEWRLRKGRLRESDEEERTYYWCIKCGKTHDKPPRERWSDRDLPRVGPPPPGGL